MNNPMPYHFVEIHGMVTYDHFPHVVKMVGGMML